MEISMVYTITYLNPRLHFLWFCVSLDGGTPGFFEGLSNPYDRQVLLKSFWSKNSE